MIGTSLGPYKIIEQLGAGGMGEVYLGEDTRLGRKVAIKVLPEEYASDPERLARFEQEARAAAALNHPHIAVVHDIGTEGDIHFMVQEYLEGQSLRERLEKGALPLDKALDLSVEVGEALIAAHKAGIIHRDLKPDNIFVTEEGHAKVLDFGLAKLTEMAAPAGSEASMSPTMLGTVAGQVMGTAGYMAPEQVNGEEVDHRVDLFAFGCVLYGMVTGRQAFAGRNVMQTLDLILAEEPTPLTEISRGLPAELQRIVEKCLAKDPTRRYQHADDLVVDLSTLALNLDSSSSRPQKVAGVQPSGDRVTNDLIVGGIVGAVLLATVVGAVVWAAMRPTPLSPKRVFVDVPVGQELTFTLTITDRGLPITVSPDGALIVYAAAADQFSDQSQLWRRDLSQFAAGPIADTQGGRDPFFSADGESIGFVVRETIRRVPTNGGPSTEVCEVPGFYQSAGWADDDTILFATAEGGLYRVPAAGGDPSLVASPDRLGEVVSLNHPEPLPGARHALATAWRGDIENSTLVVVDLESGDIEDLELSGVHPRYVTTGHIVYSQANSVLAVPFDLRTLRPNGPSVVLMEGVSIGVGGRTRLDISSQGTLVYLSAESNDTSRTLVWVDRNGVSTPLLEEPAAYGSPRLSPDGERIAFVKFEATGNSIWIHNLLTRATTVLTGGGGESPTWSPDGEWIAFNPTYGEGNADIYRIRTDFSAPAEPLLQGDLEQHPNAWSDEGLLLYQERNLDTGERSGWALRIDDEENIPIVDVAETFFGGRLSPDGRWVVYDSRDSGPMEVYVKRFPQGGRRFSISTGGGNDPMWSPDGTEIFYWRGQDIMVAKVTIGDEFTHESPSLLFSGPYWNGSGTHFDYDRGADRFVMIQATRPEGSDRINVILNWFEELKERVPTGGDRHLPHLAHASRLAGERPPRRTIPAPQPACARLR